MMDSVLVLQSPWIELLILGVVFFEAWFLLRKKPVAITHQYLSWLQVVSAQAITAILLLVALSLRKNHFFEGCLALMAFVFLRLFAWPSTTGEKTMGESQGLPWLVTPLIVSFVYQPKPEPTWSVAAAGVMVVFSLLGRGPAVIALSFISSFLMEDSLGPLMIGAALCLFFTKRLSRLAALVPVVLASLLASQVAEELFLAWSGLIGLSLGLSFFSSPWDPDGKRGPVVGILFLGLFVMGGAAYWAHLSGFSPRQEFAPEHFLAAGAALIAGGIAFFKRPPLRLVLEAPWRRFAGLRDSVLEWRASDERHREVRLANWEWDAASERQAPWVFVGVGAALFWVWVYAIG